MGDATDDIGAAGERLFDYVPHIAVFDNHSQHRDFDARAGAGRGFEDSHVAGGELCVVEGHAPADGVAFAGFEADVGDDGRECDSIGFLRRGHFARPSMSASISRLLPTMKGVRWWMPLGLMSRMRSRPLEAMPPACSAMNASGLAS